MLLGGVLMLRLTEQSLLEQKTSQLRLTTTLIAQSLAGKPLVAGNADAYDLNKLKQLPEELQFNGWWLYDRDLSLLASFSSDGVSSFTPSRRQQVRLSGQPFEEIEFPSLLGIFSQTYAFAHFIQPIYHKGHFAGLLAINYSLDDIRYHLLLS